MIQKTKQKKALSILHKDIIDQFFVNGYNRTQAVLTMLPDSSYSNAGSIASAILKDPNNKQYIEEKRAVLRSESQIDQEQVLFELINFAYSDITNFIGLTTKEIKALPSHIRRTLIGYDIKTKSYFDKSLNTTVKEETIKIKMVNKSHSIEMIAKHLDLFNADNQSKNNGINLSGIDIGTLNVLLQNVVTPIK